MILDIEEQEANWRARFLIRLGRIAWWRGVPLSIMIPLPTLLVETPEFHRLRTCPGVRSTSFDECTFGGTRADVAPRRLLLLSSSQDLVGHFRERHTCGCGPHSAGCKRRGPPPGLPELVGQVWARFAVPEMLGFWRVGGSV